MTDNIRDAMNGGALDPWPTMTGFLILGVLVDLLIVGAALVWPRAEQPTTRKDTDPREH